MNLPLTRIPLENGNREPLKVCNSCFGSGTCRTSADDYVMASGKKFQRGRPLTADEVATFNRKKWHYESAHCTTCDGAGLVKVVGK